MDDYDKLTDEQKSAIRVFKFIEHYLKGDDADDDVDTDDVEEE